MVLPAIDWGIQLPAIPPKMPITKMVDAAKAAGKLAHEMWELGFKESMSMIQGRMKEWCVKQAKKWAASYVARQLKCSYMDILMLSELLSVEDLPKMLTGEVDLKILKQNA